MKCNKEITVRMVLIGKYCGKKGNAFKYAVYPKENECVSKKYKNVERIIQLMKGKEGKVCVDGVMWYYIYVDEFYVVCVVDGDVGDSDGSSSVGELLRKYWDMWKKGKGEVNVSEKRMKELYGKCKEIKCNISGVNEGMNNIRLECSTYDEQEQHQQQQQQHTMMLSKSKQQDALMIDDVHTSSPLSMQLTSSYITTILKVNKIKTMFMILCFTFIISIYSSLPFLIRTIM